MDYRLNVIFCHDTNIGQYVIDLASRVGRWLNDGFQRRLRLVLGNIGVTIDDCTSHVLCSCSDDVHHWDEFHEVQCLVFPSGICRVGQCSLVRSELHDNVWFGLMQGALGSLGRKLVLPRDLCSVADISDELHPVSRCFIDMIEKS